MVRRKSAASAESRRWSGQIRQSEMQDWPGELSRNLITLLALIAQAQEEFGNRLRDGYMGDMGK